MARSSPPEATARASAEVGRRLDDPDAADRRREDLPVVQRAALGAALQHGQHHGQPGRVEPARPCAGASRRTVAPISACTSVTSARRPSIATVTQVPGTGSA